MKSHKKTSIINNQTKILKRINLGKKLLDWSLRWNIWMGLQLESMRKEFWYEQLSFYERQIDVCTYVCTYERDAFSFSVVRMPYLQSNMPSKTFILQSVLRFSEYEEPLINILIFIWVVKNLS